MLIHLSNWIQRIFCTKYLPFYKGIADSLLHIFKASIYVLSCKIITIIILFVTLFQETACYRFFHKCICKVTYFYSWKLPQLIIIIRYVWIHVETIPVIVMHELQNAKDSCTPPLSTLFNVKNSAFGSCILPKKIIPHNFMMIRLGRKT